MAKRLFLFFLFLPIFAFAEEEQMSNKELFDLIVEANKLEDGEEKLNAYQNIIDAATYNEINVAVKYSQAIIELAKRLYPNIIAEEKPDIFLDSYLNLNKEEVQQIAHKFYEQGYYELADIITDSIAAEIQAKGISSKLDISILRQSAFAKNAMTKSEEAIGLLSIILDYYLKSDDKLGLANTYIDFAEFYRSTFSYSLGMEYIYKAKNILVSYPNELVLRARMLGREAAIQAEGYKNAENTIRASKTVLTLAKAAKNDDLIATASNELGAAYDNDLRSISYYSTAIVIWCKLGKIENVNNAVLNVARAYLNYNFKNEAISLGEEILATCKKNNWLSLQWLTHEFLAEAYSKSNRWNESSNEMHAALQTLTLIEKQKQTQKLILEIRKHEMILAKKEADYHKKDAAEVKVQLEKELLQRRLFFVSFFALVIILLVMYIGYQKNKKTNQMLNAALAQKDVLLKEVHHRVKNSLQLVSSLLNLQSIDLKDSDAFSAIKDGQSRVKTIALIHQKLYQTEDISGIELKDYITQLVDLLRTTYVMPDKHIVTQLDIVPLTMDIEKAVPLGLIINEAVSNAFKYAFVDRTTGVITVRLSQTNSNTLELIVSDNGIGIDQKVVSENPATLGLKLIKILTKQLKGYYSILTVDGTTTTIVFPF